MAGIHELSLQITMLNDAASKVVSAYKVPPVFKLTSRLHWNMMMNLINQLEHAIRMRIRNES